MLGTTFTIDFHRRNHNHLLFFFSLFCVFYKMFLISIFLQLVGNIEHEEFATLIKIHNFSLSHKKNHSFNVLMHPHHNNKKYKIK